ncbi:hypothetical protein IWX49DRAFT_580655 [Phyllosticta citricarpa]|uniref:Secreted protein n=1 Tax=Phyllosticta citricarpa TaxID=55181 RepID=A0ABR1LMU7_9PEZI
MGNLVPADPVRRHVLLAVQKPLQPPGRRLLISSSPHLSLFLVLNQGFTKMADDKPQEHAQQPYQPYQSYSSSQNSPPSAPSYQSYKPYTASGSSPSEEQKESAYLPYRPAQQGAPDRNGSPSAFKDDSQVTEDPHRLPEALQVSAAPKRKTPPLESGNEDCLPGAEKAQPEPESKEQYRAYSPEAQQPSAAPERRDTPAENASKHHEPDVVLQSEPTQQYRPISPEVQQTSALPERKDSPAEHASKSHEPAVAHAQSEPEQQYGPFSPEAQHVPSTVNDSVPQIVIAPSEVNDHSVETRDAQPEPTQQHQPQKKDDPADGIYDLPSEVPPALPPKVKEDPQESHAAPAISEFPPDNKTAFQEPSSAPSYSEYPPDNKKAFDEPTSVSGLSDYPPDRKDASGPKESPHDFEEQPPAYHEIHPPVQDGAQDGASEPIREYYSPDLKHAVPEPAEYAQSEVETPPPFPPRPADYRPPLPPRRSYQKVEDDDPSNPIHYTRDPHKLIAYLIPFPKPKLNNVPVESIPDRFLIYTPPPPPLTKPAEGEKEGRVHKVQRKWQEEVRNAKMSTAKAASWQGIRSKATKGIDWAIKQTTSSNLDFVNRMTGSATSENANAPKAIEGHPEDASTPATATADSTAADKEEDGGPSKAVPLTHLTLVYPSSLPYTPAELRREFISSMLRSTSKAQRDSILATGLLPVSVVVDTLIMFVWPFGGLFEADTVWAYSSIRGAKIARSTTKRLQATSEADGVDDGAAAVDADGHFQVSPADAKDKDKDKDKDKGKGKEKDKPKTKKKNDDQEPTLSLEFRPSSRLSTLQRYLAHRCHERCPAFFPYPSGACPTETEVLEAIAWAPSQAGGATRNWEDERWEVAEVKEDFRGIMSKGAREWEKWCRLFEEDPTKVGKK